MPRLTLIPGFLLAAMILAAAVSPARAQVIINNGGAGIIIMDRAVDSSDTEKIQQDPAGADRIEFFDGSQLHGTLDSVDMEHRQLIWRRSDASNPMAIPLQRVSQLHFDQSRKDASLHATIKFTGGDWLAADITHIQDNKIHLQLADHSALEVNRSQVDWIYFSKGAAAECYDGPEGMAGWVSGGSWTYRAGALRASMPSQIGHSFAALPDQVDYQFEVDQGRLMDAFNFSLHGRVGQEWNAGPGIIQCVIQANTLNVWAMIDGRFRSEQVDLENIIGGALDGRIKRGKSNPVQFRVLEDFPGGRLLIYINGHKVADYNIGKGEAGKNQGSFTFQPTVWNAYGEQTLSKIRVVPWDGRMPDDPAKADEPVSDLVSQADGTVHEGKLIDFAEGTVRIRSGNKTIETPKEQLRLLRFGGTKEASNDAPSMARLRLADGGDLDASDIGWRDGKFLVRSRFGVELVVSPSSLTEVRFSQSPPMLALAGDTLVFKNGDQLRGHLGSTGASEHLRWRTDEAAATDFELARIAGIRLGSASDDSEKRIDCVARFSNGDWLAGQFLTVDKAELVLNTQDAGQLSIPRSRLKAIYFSKDGLLPIADGIADAPDWLRGLDLANSQVSEKGKSRLSSLWRCFDGRYSLAAPEGNFNVARIGGVQIGRLMPSLPTLAEISFDASGHAGQIIFSAQLFSEAGNPGYLLQFHSQGLNIYDLNPGVRGRAGVAPQQTQFDDKLKPNTNHRHIQLLANRDTGQLTVFVDGVLVTRFGSKSAANPRKLGRGIMLSPQPGLSGSFSNIWVGPWSGQMPADMVPADPNPESVTLNNGDETEGAVELATPNSVRLTSDIGPLDLPVDRLTMIDFGGPSPESTPGTKLHLTGLGTLTVTACRIEEGAVHCKSEAVGDLNLPLAALREIVFPDSTRDR
jgi:hypothetical protein